MKYTHILFDLDGTITDPKMGITNSVIYALEKYGITGKTNDDLLSFIGPPLKESFMKYYNFSEEDAVQGIEYFREYFKVKGLYENIPYEGIEELLITLKDKGYRLAVATSKPTHFAEIIIKHFKLDKYFDFIGGSKLDNTRVAKAEVIEYVLENLDMKDTSKVIMIGDREHDVLGAKHHDIKSIGVLYGYGSREEFESVGTDVIVADVEELKNVLINI